MDVVQARATVLQFGSNANRRLFLSDTPSNPNSLTDLIAQTPGVDKSGQNGLFQVFSIRGVSGQRVQTRFNGVPIATERRAGTAASFVAPWLIDYVDVVRGPASAYFGSGAIGGAMLATPRFFDGIAADVGYENASTLRSQSLGLGNENWSFGISNRTAADGEDPHGVPLHTGFEQVSALLQNRIALGDLRLRGSLLSSRGNDIGRSNSQYPLQRISSVVEESHDLLQLGMSSGKGWQAELYAHDQATVSDTVTVGSTFNRVANASLDWGGRLSSTWTLGRWSGELGTEFQGRDRVHADELTIDLDSRQRAALTNLAANQRAYSLFAVGAIDVGQHNIQFGIRQDWLQQDARDAQRRNNQILTGYAEWQWFLGDAWSVSGEVATAYRDPSLSELYFTGSTGRGDTLGNPALRQEQAPGVDLGLHWRRGYSDFNAHWFAQSFRNYIERTVIDADTRSYANVLRGTIRGVELEGTTSFGERWAISYGAHWIEGEDAAGRPLADIPAIAAELGITLTTDKSQARLYWHHRASNSRVAATELAIDAADSVDASYRYHLSPRASVSFYMTNVLNDHYRISKDDISTADNRRTFGVRLTLQRDGSSSPRSP